MVKRCDVSLSIYVLDTSKTQSVQLTFCCLDFVSRVTQCQTLNSALVDTPLWRILLRRKVKWKQGTVPYSNTRFRPVNAFCSDTLSPRALVYRCRAQGLLQFAVTADEDSESDSRGEAKSFVGSCVKFQMTWERDQGCGQLRKSSSSGINPPDLKSCPPLG